ARPDPAGAAAVTLPAEGTGGAPGEEAVSASDLRQRLYLIADELRGLASLSGHHADNVHETERADRAMGLAAELAALADGAAPETVRADFLAEPWLRFSPAVGVDAAVFDPEGRILLVLPEGNVGWAMPGGLADIGETPSEAVLRELWEEVGLRGQVRRLLGLFDARRWGTRAKVHLIQLVFLVECERMIPSPGVEILEAGFFPPDDLPAPLRVGHDTRIPKILEILRGSTTFFDPADSNNADLPMHQRPSGEVSP
ncbi:MAG: NUDIX domain-containing protein, partial [Chloroflexota bacterium]|nr:NUDIX domain-containing protein [Chloroflexota bacterium]